MARQEEKKKKRSFSRKPQRKEEREKRRGPRLPSSLRHLQNPPDDDNHEDEEGGGRPALSSDMYEYEENQAPEESHKNRRFDAVDRLEYELPSDFEDEEIDEGAADGEDHGGQNKRPKGKKHLAFGKRKQARGQQSDEEDDSDEEVSSESDDSDTHKQGKRDKSNKDEDQSDNEDEELQGEEEEDVEAEQEESDIEAEEGDDEDDERHQRMIEAVRKSRIKDPREKRPKHVELLSEAYPESEFNINPTTDGNKMQQITVEDLMTPLQTTTGFGSLRKRMQQLEKKGVVLDAPLPNAVQDRLSRKAGYEKANEEISKWQEIVKKNREAASLVFTQRPDLTAVSTAELVSKFEPITGLEKEVASLLRENGLAEESSEAGTGLGFNKVTLSEVKERQERLAKMRSMLSYHEAKAKRMKKIKSKTFHRLLQKDRKGKAGVEELDPEALKEAALKAEFKRAQERMTLKHKNTSKWAKRIIQRGLKAKEDGSREALAEQLRTNTALTRKIHAVDDVSSSDDSSDEMGADSGTEDANGGLSLSAKPRSKVLAKAKVETLKVLEGDAEAEIPTSGLFSLPFMARAIEKKRKQAQNEAMAVLEQLEQLEYNVDGNEDFEFEEREAAAVASTGRLGFGDMAKSMSNAKEQEPDMLVEEGSSSDETEDRVIPAVKKKPVVSKKRKAASNGSIDKICNGVASQAHKLQVTEEAWINGGVDRAKVSNGAVSQSQKLQVAEEADVPLEDSDAGGSVAGAANPWLYGDLNGNKENVAAEKVGGQRVGMSMDERPVSLVTSASIEVVNVAKRGKRKVGKNVKAVQNGGILEEAKEMASLSTSDSDEEAEEPGFRLSTENASQAELIQRAFAGDDVEADFEQMKNEALSEEVPMGESALSLPGWGQWTDVQKRKGPPLWMVKQQEELKRSRDQALGKRKDSKLKHVIISERMDKKAEKFLAPALPFPFQSRDVFEKSMRMPLGREYNTDQVFRDMIRPAVVKDAGVIIDPIKYKMSDAKAGESNGVPEEKKSEKRANGPRFKRKS